MALDRVMGVAQISRSPAARSDAGAATAPTGVATPPAGQADGLRPQQGLGPPGELLARSAEGQRFSLPATALAGLSLTAGQLLLVKVLSTSPRLELVLLGSGREDAAAAATNTEAAELAASQPDQAAIRRMVAQTLDTPALASSWRSMMLARLQLANLVPETAGQLRLSSPPDALPHGREPGGALADSASHQAAPALMFQTLLWHGVTLSVWLRPDRYGDAAARRRTHRQGLRLVLTLAELGLVEIEVDVQDQTVALTLTAAQPLAEAVLRSRVSLISARLAHVGLHLMRCHVAHGPVTEPVTAAGAAHAVPSEANLPLVLFRGAAEVVAGLSPPFQ